MGGGTSVGDGIYLGGVDFGPYLVDGWWGVAFMGGGGGGYPKTKGHVERDTHGEQKKIPPF